MFQVRVFSSACLVSLLGVITRAVAQLSAPDCTDASYEWVRTNFTFFRLALVYLIFSSGNYPVTIGADI